jgi:hypothetical protein
MGMAPGDLEGQLGGRDRSPRVCSLAVPRDDGPRMQSKLGSPREGAVKRSVCQAETRVAAGEARSMHCRPEQWSRVASQVEFSAVAEPSSFRMRALSHFMRCAFSVWRGTAHSCLESTNAPVRRTSGSSCSAVAGLGQASSEQARAVARVRRGRRQHDRHERHDRHDRHDRSDGRDGGLACAYEQSAPCPPSKRATRGTSPAGLVALARGRPSAKADSGARTRYRYGDLVYDGQPSPLAASPRSAPHSS